MFFLSFRKFIVSEVTQGGVVLLALVFDPSIMFLDVKRTAGGLDFSKAVETDWLCPLAKELEARGQGAQIP